MRATGTTRPRPSLVAALFGLIAVLLAAAAFAPPSRAATSAEGLSAGVAGPAGHQLPFRCGQAWTGKTRAQHRPSPAALDFNRPADLGRVVLASAPGVVTRVQDTGATSYGKWIQVAHPDGYSTVYAHLKAQWVVPGQPVDQGAVLGRVGATGGVSGAHLHYEQRWGSTVVTALFTGLPFLPGSTAASLNCGDVPLAGDWDGDRVDELAVFRREAAGGRFVLRRTPPALRLGRPTDLPVAGDWDGDGATDVGVRRQSTRTFILRRPDGTLVRTRFGEVRDLPVVGDWNGDGTSDLGVWRPRAGQFRLLLPNGRQRVVSIGSAGSQPVTGDWDGDGVTDVGVHDPSTGFRLRTVTRGVAAETVVPLGTSTDLPVTGDWDGDGVTDLGTWTPGTATFTLRTANPEARRAVARLPQLRTVVFGRPR